MGSGFCGGQTEDAVLCDFGTFASGGVFGRVRDAVVADPDAPQPGYPTSERAP